MLTKVSAARLIGCDIGQFSRVDIGRDSHTEICPHCCRILANPKADQKPSVERPPYPLTTLSKRLKDLSLCLFLKSKRPHSGEIKSIK